MTSQVDSALKTFTFPSKVDQAPIFVRRWLSLGIRPHATVQITHGIAEHSGRYDCFARFLMGLGYVVYAIDLRGHGKTAGLENLGQGSLTAWEDMTADIKQLSDIARTEYSTLPLISFGHSMGSGLTQSHIQNHGSLLAGAVLCGTFGAMPGGLPDAQYETVIRELRALERARTPESPAHSLANCSPASRRHSSRASQIPRVRSGRPATPRKSACFKRTRFAGSLSRTA